MVLVLAVHTVKEVTAKVSFSTILLQDLVTNKKTPPEHKCRQVWAGKHRQIAGAGRLADRHAGRLDQQPWRDCDGSDVP